MRIDEPALPGMPVSGRSRLWENLPTSATGAVAKSLDVVAGNENGEIEKVTSGVMLVVGTKGVLDILIKPEKITNLDKLSMIGTLSDYQQILLSKIIEETEDDNTDDE